MPPITFSDKDFQAIDPKKGIPMVINIELAKFDVMETLLE